MNKNVFFIYFGIILLIVVIIAVSFPDSMINVFIHKKDVFNKEIDVDRKKTLEIHATKKNKECFFRGIIGEGSSKNAVFEYSGETLMLVRGDTLFDYRIEKITEKEAFLFNVVNKKNKIRLEIGESFGL